MYIALISVTNASCRVLVPDTEDITKIMEVDKIHPADVRIAKIEDICWLAIEMNIERGRILRNALAELGDNNA